MDYSELSDAEISQKVWFWWNSNVQHDGKLCGISGDQMLYVKNRVWTAFDPCKNPADAWPIIEKNKIGVRNISGDLWECASPDGMKADYSSRPLQSGMIVFLMMQEDACKTK